jgi:hypothetical protein
VAALGELLRGGKAESARAGAVPIGVRELRVAAAVIGRSKRPQIRSTKKFRPVEVLA